MVHRLVQADGTIILGGAIPSGGEAGPAGPAGAQGPMGTRWGTTPSFVLASLANAPVSFADGLPPRVGDLITTSNPLSPGRVSRVTAVVDATHADLTNTALDLRGPEGEGIEDSGWIAPTLASGWSNYDVNWESSGYRKINGVVYLRGLIRTTPGAATQTQILNLPVGYRSIHHQHVVVGVNGAAGIINIYGDGNIKTNTVIAAGGWISLRNIAYPADQ